MLTLLMAFGSAHEHDVPRDIPADQMGMVEMQEMQEMQEMEEIVETLAWNGEPRIRATRFS